MQWHVNLCKFEQKLGTDIKPISDCIAFPGTECMLWPQSLAASDGSWWLHRLVTLYHCASTSFLQLCLQSYMRLNLDGARNTWVWCCQKQNANRDCNFVGCHKVLLVPDAPNLHIVIIGSFVSKIGVWNWWTPRKTRQHVWAHDAFLDFCVPCRYWLLLSLLFYASLLLAFHGASPQANHLGDIDF